MSEPRSDAPSQPPVGPPADRYATADRGSNLTGKVVAVILALLVGGLVVAGVYTTWRLNQTPDITGEAIGVEVVDETRVDLTFTVTREEPGTPAYCIIRAQEESKGELGRREVYVPPSENTTIQIDASVFTTGRAFAADVYGCGDDVPDYLRR
ncbi:MULTISPECIES: DUF4307 domain-containing protein [Dietzia]|uniref:DUF4307 domain-containing protein n=1 Tax=Dietzia maris TaxID=37915 RepID=A0ABT8H349_9ACTN|nr:MULTISPECIES: DUF4307 domain-containing protein [Dietzia]MDN4506885.1 DUF4307 domain-containing protein [Dietzia maris]OAV78136.1 hypothetical protein AYO52_13860 [Dietzia sp. 111N12-1]